jgi:Brp/Blh family beta-carotene 15,15'-monooxygenase
MAIGHYQFEAIHPFTDGNGRTGRVLNSLFLIQEGLLSLPILYLSRFIIENKTDYYHLLLGVTRDYDWEAWILFLLTKNIHFALDIFLKMGRSSIQKEFLVQLAQKIYPYTLVTIAIVYGLLFFYKDYFFTKKNNYYYSLLQTLLLIFFVLYMPLWISFTFYFGFWHSILSFDKIRINFKIANTLTGWGRLLFKALPFSIMAWFGFAYITFLTLNSKDSSGIFTLLFISLSVLALPHLQVFTKLKLKEH